MAKQNRGKALWKLPARGKGICPVCGHTRIKLLYELIKSDGSKIKVCKSCQHKKI
jgi:ribosome-binding protein aMBF1 (putative translation factor)